MAKQPEKKSNEIATPPTDSSNSLAREIEQQIGPLVARGQRDQIVSRVVKITQSEKFKGPIAHPRHLREYEEILPGSADRIIRMAESELLHNQNMQSAIIDAEISDVRLGRAYGFCALLVLIISASITGYLGLQALSLALLGIGVLGIISVFIKGRSGNGAEPSE